MNDRVLIAHSSDWLGVARLPKVLRAGGAHVTVMAPRGSYVLQTRYAHEKITVPSSLDELIGVLGRHLRQHTYRWVIVADDPLLNALADRRASEPWIADILPVPNQRVEMLTSKIAFLDRCREAGLPIAPSENVSTADAALEAAHRIGYPVMLKLPTGSGGSGVTRIERSEQMIATFDSFAVGRTVTVERFIEGRICGCETLFDHGRPVCWSPFFKYRCYPRFGPSAVRLCYSEPRLADIVRTMGALTAFHGFATFCYIEDAQRNELVLLELNFRPGVGMHLSGRIGAMFSAGVVAVLAGRPTRGRATPGLRGHLASMFPQDLTRGLAERDYADLWGTMLRGRMFADIPFSDPPLLAALTYGLARDWLPSPLHAAARAGLNGWRHLHAAVD